MFLGSLLSFTVSGAPVSASVPFALERNCNLCLVNLATRSRPSDLRFSPKIAENFRPSAAQLPDTPLLPSAKSRPEALPETVRVVNFL